LRRYYYKERGSTADAAILRSALDLLEAQAQFDDPDRTVHIRIAEHAGHIYLDLNAGSIIAAIQRAAIESASYICVSIVSTDCKLR
jgi:hypothetical protein